MVPEALSLQWDLLGLRTSWVWQAWLRQYEVPRSLLGASILGSEHRAHVHALSPFPGMIQPPENETAQEQPVSRHG